MVGDRLDLKGQAVHGLDTHSIPCTDPALAARLGLPEGALHEDLACWIERLTHLADASDQPGLSGSNRFVALSCDRLAAGEDDEPGEDQTGDDDRRDRQVVPGVPPGEA